jgi:oligosaccharyl transferase (archaeosortase A-associated)
MSRFNVMRWPRTNVLFGLALALVCVFSFLLRVLGPYSHVFAGDWVRFQWFDPWYHMRLVENMVHHFPQRIFFDPYTYFPNGQDVFFAPMYDWMLGSLAWVLGAGSPSQGTVETLGAYFPVIIGTLVLVPVYFVGKALFGRKVGLAAAALLMILPGQFLLRTLLGFSDHHGAEVLFSTLTMLFLILAVKRARETELSFRSIATGDWRTLKMPLVFTVLAGLSLGMYLLTWVGGALFLFIIFIFGLVQYVSDHLRGRSTDYLCAIAAPCFLIALVMVAPSLGRYGYVGLQVQALALGIGIFALLSAFSFLMARRNMNRIYYPFALAVFGGAGLGLLYAVAPSVTDAIWESMRVFTPNVEVLNIGEMQPLFLPQGSFSLSMVWEEFTTTFFIALIPLALLVRLAVKEGAPDKMLFLVWCLITLLAAIGQNRFAYYYAVNVSLLSAYLSWRVLVLAPRIKVPEALMGAFAGHGSRRATGKEKAKLSKKAKHKKAKAGAKEPESEGSWRRTAAALTARYPVTRHGLTAIVAIALFFLVFYPNIGMAIEIPQKKSQPNDDWYAALVWMRENTPDPFDNPDFYYEWYPELAEGEEYAYPDSAYGVMSWWDYGHWITYIAHRIPHSNPHQVGAPSAGRFFTSGDPEAASQMLEDLGCRYVVAYFMMAMPDPRVGDPYYGHFTSMVDWAGGSLSDFFDRYYGWRNQEGELESRILYYPAYYQSMSTRLYLFGGHGWMPRNSAWVIGYDVKTTRDGREYNQITEQQLFATYDEARLFLESRDSSRYRIVGDNPLLSPIPLEPLEHYEQIYSSPTMAGYRGDFKFSEVEIFEYKP